MKVNDVKKSIMRRITDLFKSDNEVFLAREIANLLNEKPQNVSTTLARLNAAYKYIESNKTYYYGSKSAIGKLKKHLGVK